ncbi:redoxin domain-containing protein [Alkalicoccus chagannorensis]|uniref:redoxin domain-containing protein n=1 Tax=Alkalicoccus chagannorensis TaxID=427072 RepID=UPI0004256806|nr:redoxin domain-containing protein [Alkalicoccus chagannorensis]
MDQLVQLDEQREELEELGYNVYGISPAPPEQHQQAIDHFDLDIELLSDPMGQVGMDHDFIDDENMIYRGFMAVQPETNQYVKEIDYLAGDNIDQVKETLESMNP